jgi:mevalonate kinase
MKITYSAPLPIIFSGEEGMIYGKPGLGVAADTRVTITLLAGAQHGKDTIGKTVDIVDQVVRKALKAEYAPYAVTIETDIPDAYAGYTQAVLAALTACITEFYSVTKPALELVNKLAYTSDRQLDKHSLGLLVSTAVFGGLVYFRKEFEFLKTVYKLPYNVPESFSSLLQVEEPLKDSTLHESIADLYKNDPDKAEYVLVKLEKITKRMIVAIMKEDAPFFSQQIEERKQLIRTLSKSSLSFYTFAFSPEGVTRE